MAFGVLCAVSTLLEILLDGSNYGRATVRDGVSTLLEILPAYLNFGVAPPRFEAVSTLLEILPYRSRSAGYSDAHYYVFQPFLRFYTPSTAPRLCRATKSTSFNPS